MRQLQGQLRRPRGSRIRAKRAKTRQNRRKRPPFVPLARRRRPWRRRNRPRAARSGAQRNKLSRRNSRSRRVKKIGCRFERATDPGRHNYCGSGKSLPMAIFGASAHPPQAPIWLDPSGCPPGRVFHFGRSFERTGKFRKTTALAHAPLMPLDKPHLFHKIILSKFSDSSALVCVRLLASSGCS